jgi:hypothetical protein
VRPSWIEPITTSEPTQNSSEASTKPSAMREEPSPEARRRWTSCPKSSRRRSIPINSPSAPPSRTPPSTYSGVCRVLPSSLQASPSSTPITSVIKPRPDITRC